MQQLHLVGFTTDLEGLIFAARRGAKSGGFVVSLDDELIDAIDDAFERRAVANGEGEDGERSTSGLAHRRSPRAESTLTPREIQARLRSGRSISEVARAAGVDEDWVARFAAPIQAEQHQVVTRVRSIVYSKPRLGPSAQPLGSAVFWNLRDKGVLIYDDTFEAGWSAFHVRESEWTVRFAYINRKKAQYAEWLVDLADGELISRNRLASELAYIEPGRRRRRPVPLGDAPAPPPPPAPGRARRPAKKSAVKKATGAKKSAAVKKAVAKTTAVKKAPKKATAKKATAKKPTAKKPTAKRAPKKTGTKRTAATKRTATRPGSRTRAPAVDAPPASSPQSVGRRERRAQRIPPSTVARPRVAVNPVVQTPAPRSFVPTTSRPPARRPDVVISDRAQRRSAPSAEVIEPPRGNGLETPPTNAPPAEPVAPAEVSERPLIVIDDADSSVRRISSRNPAPPGDSAVTIRAPMAATTLPPPAPVSSRRFRRRGRDAAADRGSSRD